MGNPTITAAAVLAANWRLMEEEPGTVLAELGDHIGLPAVLTVDGQRFLDLSDEDATQIADHLIDLHNATLWVPAQPSGPLTAVLAEVAACVETTAGMRATKDGMSPAQWQGDIDSDVAALVDCMGAPTDRYRVRLIRIAALAVAAALSWDRRQGAAKPQAGVPHG